MPPQALAMGLRPPLAPPPFRRLAAGLAVDPAPQSGPSRPPHESGSFAFLGTERAFRDDPGFWSAEPDGLLFAFLLHDFHELAGATADADRGSDAAAFWTAVLDSWLRHCATPAHPAWHPFPLSGRLLAWCAALAAPERLLDATLEERLISSAWHQMRYLRRAVEHDVGGNHVIRNACALLTTGICFDDASVVRFAERLLQRELPRQVLSDGGHEERSPSYHRAVLYDLDDLLELCRRAGRPPATAVSAAAADMRRWQSQMAGPAGDLPLLNDAWCGPPVAGRPDDAITVLRDSGYLILRHDQDQAVLDVGPLGPRHLPAHVHADALSFVLWADGRPLIVDRGTYTYAGADRNRFRATAAHNTVEIDDADQCELWGPFRASFLPRVELLAIEHGVRAVIVRARHDGYRRLGDPVIHERTFAWLHGDGLVVVDRLHCEQPHRAATRLHLPCPPDARGRVGTMSLEPLGAGPPPSSVPCAIAPHFGQLVAGSAVERRLEARPHERFGWALLRDATTAELRGDHVLVRRPGGAVLRVDC